jgi:cellulose synthase (UDP-forming)
MMGRRNYRQGDRFKAELPVEIDHRGQKFSGQTTDISEGGLAVNFTFPAYLLDYEIFMLRLDGGVYQAEMKCMVVHVDPLSGKGWRYSFKVMEIDEANQREYSQIIYDRPHSLPVRISDNVTMLDDFRSNVEKRLWDEQQVKAIRRLPRLPLGLKLIDIDGNQVTVEDFNYKFVWLTSEFDLPLETEVSISLGIPLKLKQVNEQNRFDKRGALYIVENLEELLESHVFNIWLERWVRSQIHDVVLPSKISVIQMPITSQI